MAQILQRASPPLLPYVVNGIDTRQCRVVFDLFGIENVIPGVHPSPLLCTSPAEAEVTQQRRRKYKDGVRAGQLFIADTNVQIAEETIRKTMAADLALAKELLKSARCFLLTHRGRMAKDWFQGLLRRFES